MVFKGPLRFVLSASGHIAGVFNPASSNKYDYWANDKVIKTYPQSPERCLVSAKEYKQSWGHDWQEWITSHGYSGNKVKARQVGEGALPVIEPAPGSYVCKRS